MGFPKRLLSEDEELVLDIRPHWIALLLPLLVAALLVALEVLVLVNIPDRWPDWVRWAVVAAGVVFFLAVPARRIIAWATSHFVVTSERVIHRSGWLARRAMEMPLDRINDVRFEQSVLERIVGGGDLVIESGGEYGQNHFTDIRKPEDVQKLIYETAEVEESGDRPPLDEIERLAALKERGAISEEEFETHKRRLLGRL
ncbi:MAG TPA: PH domain-containing protein [Actinomycetota bacterium]|nr:PH domain-containing protein [Actinomycetota bacterium]